jgi:phosphopantetheinyl transferase
VNAVLTKESGTRARVELAASTDIGATARRYLTGAEQRAFEAMAGRARVPWLLGRVAAKDALGHHLHRRDLAEVDPLDVVVANNERGCPYVIVRGALPATHGLQISIAHKPTMAVALAARPRLGGIGIDIEAVQPRSYTFERAALTPAERSLSRTSGTDRDAWLTRLWTVKEAAAKATGLGLQGRPRDFEIDAVDGRRFSCRGVWICSESVSTASGVFVIAWTEADVAAPGR